MKKRNVQIRGAFFFALIATASQVQAQTEEIDSNIYFENTAPITLHQLEAQPNGDSLMIPRLQLPEDSTLSVAIPDLARQLELQILSPEQVNYPYAESRDAKKSPIRKSKDGFVCGVRVIDVPDEDFQESEDLDTAVFCVANKILSRLRSVEGDEESSKQAFRSYLERKDTKALVDLSKKVQAEEEARAGRIMDIAATKVGSPLKGCGKGCLKVTSGFGKRKAPVKGASRYHKGLDLRARSGTPVVAVLSGKILANKSQRKGKKLVGYGHYVIMSHPATGMQTKYAHLSGFKRKAGQSVKQGEVIASSGNTGTGSAPHLHFETLKGSRAVNPKTFLKGIVSRGLDWMKDLGILFA